MAQEKKRIKILCIGNSFSEDTIHYVAEIARAAGYQDVLAANLFIGGCPIRKHYENIKNDLPAYRYGRNDGSGWIDTPDTRISDAVLAEDWDWISIQHGSSYGAVYTRDECYQDLEALVKEVKALARSRTKIAFNMTWVGEPYYDRPEMLAFNRDQKRLFEAICAITERLVLPAPGIDLVCPTGTAVQNARTTALGDRMSRDGYHLSLDVGRYLAGLTFFKTLTGECVAGLNWRPEGVGEQDVELILKSVDRAIESPFAITTIL